jgi:GT2 family glycosyltransferase
MRLPLSADGARYRSLLAIVRLNGDPFGAVVVAVDEDGTVSRAQLGSEVRNQLGLELSAEGGNATPCNQEMPELTKRSSSPVGGQRPAPAPSIAGNRLTASPRPARDQSISVVVTTCCNVRPLTRCLRSIFASDYDKFEVIVVENRPGSGATQEMLAEQFGHQQRLHYLEEPRRGLSYARNRGLNAASCEFVAFTDDDVVVDRSWIRRALQAFDQQDDIACVTGLILPLELETDSQLLLEQSMTLGKGFRPRVFRLVDAFDTSTLLPYTAGSVGSGANTVLRVNVAHELRGFEETLGTGTPAAGGEDLDLYIRLLRRGHAIAYEPGAIVWHAHPSSTAELRRQVYWYGVGLGATLAKQLVAGPDRQRLIRALPAGIRYLLDPTSRKNAAKTVHYPRSLNWLERVGICLGPAAYAASALKHRHQSLRTR